VHLSECFSPWFLLSSFSHFHHHYNCPLSNSVSIPSTQIFWRVWSGGTQMPQFVSVDLIESTSAVNLSLSLTWDSCAAGRDIRVVEPLTQQCTASSSVSGESGPHIATLVSRHLIWFVSHERTLLPDVITKAASRREFKCINRPKSGCWDTVLNCGPRCKWLWQTWDLAAV